MSRPPKTTPSGDQRWFKRNDGPVLVAPRDCYAMWAPPCAGGAFLGGDLMRTVHVAGIYPHIWEKGTPHRCQ